MHTKAAMYLVGHGPYREPRFIEMQYLRLLRYYRIMNKYQEEYLKLERAYIDINYPRENFTFEGLPQLEELINDIHKENYKIVLIDIDIGEFYKYMPIINTLDETSAKIYNCYYDDGEFMKKEIKERFGNIDTNNVLPDDIEEFIALYPAFSGKVIKEICSDKKIKSIDDLYDKIDSLRSKSPYKGSSLPWFSENVSNHLMDLKQKNIKERRKKEVLYILGPNEDGYLLDEYISGSPRSEDNLSWAINRLYNIGFSEVKHHNKISYIRKIENHSIYADPRIDGKLIFSVYNNRKEINESKKIGEFYIMDTWYNNLEEKIISRYNKIINEYE